MTGLAALSDLPEDYRQRLSSAQLAPLWPMLRNFMPYGKPARRARGYSWAYETIRPLLLEAGDLTPIERAERRVLVLCNPGYAFEEAQATPTIYLGMQLIKPGEVAPPHRHSAAAIRMIVEGVGAYTTVEGQKLVMEPGDLILTPAGLWHEHGHEGEEPVIWLDALDLPLSVKLEACYSEDGGDAEKAPSPEGLRYLAAGLAPPRDDPSSSSAYPMMRYPWRTVRGALDGYEAVRSNLEPVCLRYVNPLSGGDCLPTFSMSAWKLRPGEERGFARRSCSSVYHVIEGEGCAEIDGESFRFEPRATFAAPTHAEVLVRNGSTSKPAYIFALDDSPVHRALKIYQEFESPHR